MDGAWRVRPWTEVMLREAALQKFEASQMPAVAVIDPAIVEFNKTVETRQVRKARARGKTS